MATVREDVVKLGFDVDWGELNKFTDTLDETKAMLTGGMGDDAFDELIKESKKAAKGLEGVKDNVNGIKSDGLDDTVKALKDTDEKGEDAYKELKKIGDAKFNKTVSGLKNIGTQLKNVGIQAGKMLAKGIVAGVAGVGALVTKAITGYADYEQLVGGVETLFKDSAGTVQKYASDAWKTAGVSENTYMETATSFSASLIQSLGGDTAKAAAITNMAITDMSDNANKMGSDMETLIGTYQSLSRGNYAMLDNLKLGYGGTKEELKRLLSDAQKLTGVKYSLSSFSDVISAIHAIQENMGITGTTAKEASETISGSANAMKAAWGNTLTSLILGGDDLDRSIDNLVTSATTFMKNLMPALVKSLGGVGSLIEEICPLIEENMPLIVETLLPPLIKAATALVKGLIVALPDIIGTLVGEMPGILSEVWDGISEAFGDVPGIEKVETFFGKMKTLISENTELIKNLTPVALGLVVAIKLFNKVKGITGLFGGGSGGSGTGGAFNAKSMLTAMGGIAVALGGIGLIVAAFGGLQKIEGYDTFIAGGGEALGQLCGIIGDIGLVGAAFVGFVGLVGKNVSIADAAVGIADIAIALLGMEAIVAAFGALALIDGYSDFISGGGDAMKQLCGIIEEIALVGAAFVAFVAVVGTFANVATAASGMGVIATALLGMEAVVLAFGALSRIDGIDEFIADGGEMLTNLCNIIGDMAGNLIGGALAGLSDGLPDIGANIASFAENVAPALETFGSAKTQGISDFATALSSLIGVLVSENVSSFFFGDIDYAGLGTSLTQFAVKAMPFFAIVKNIPDEAFAKITSLFNALAGIKALPTDGGVKGWLMGDINFDKIASGLKTLATDDFLSAITKIQNIPETGFTAMTKLFNALADIKAMPKEGGIADWFTGSESATLTNVAAALPGVATHVKTFFDNLGGRINFSPIKNLFDTLNSVKIDTDATKGTGFLGLGASAMESMGTGLSGFATNAKTFFDTVNGLDTSKLGTLFDKLGTAGELPDTLSTLDSSVGTALTNLVTTATTQMDAVYMVFSDELGSIVQLMNTTATVMETSGASIMSGVNTGMESMRSTLVATAASIAADIQSAFDVELDINSPSRKTMKSGQFVGEGYDLGMQSTIPQLQDTARSMADASIPYTSHYSPDTDSSTVYNSRTSTETTTISPTFNLTISGTQDDRTTARKVKQWVNDAMNEFFESLERKTAVTREA